MKYTRAFGVIRILDVEKGDSIIAVTCFFTHMFLGATKLLTDNFIFCTSLMLNSAEGKS